MAWMREAIAPRQQFITKDKTLPAPIGGWVSNENIAEPPPKTARVLENWFPTRKGARLRGGSFKFATVHASNAVKSIFAYSAGGTEKLFCATADSIFNITSPATPTTIPSADITGQTSGYYSTAPFANAAGTVYLTIVNGTDARQLYDGATFATAPAITGVTGDTNGNTLSYAWVFASRLFFVQKNSYNAWYLAVDNVGGAASVFSLAGIFQDGGTLLTGGTWSVDAGDGMHEQCVFISTLGEVAVYQGTDPSDTSKWAKVGVYHMGQMLGKNALLKVAGDLLLCTVDGFVPMSMVQKLDRAALSLNAISRNIEPDWKAEAANRNDHWTLVKWPQKDMTLIALPSGTNLANRSFAINSETGAWADYVGWDTNCVTLFQTNVYFGTSSGTVYLAENGGKDGTANYTCTYIGQHENWGYEGRYKTAQLMRTTFIASNPFTPKVSVLANYSTTAPSPPSAAADIASSTWDSGLWDAATWDSSGMQSIPTRWRPVSGAGFAMAPCVQVTCGATNTPDAQMVTNQVRFGVGEMVV